MGRPSSLQTTTASAFSHPSSQTDPHSLLWQNSTRPSKSLAGFLNLMLPSMQTRSVLKISPLIEYPFPYAFKFFMVTIMVSRITDQIWEWHSSSERWNMLLTEGTDCAPRWKYLYLALLHAWNVGTGVILIFMHDQSHWNAASIWYQHPRRGSTKYNSVLCYYSQWVSFQFHHRVIHSIPYDHCHPWHLLELKVWHLHDGMIRDTVTMIV